MKRTHLSFSTLALAGVLSAVASTPALAKPSEGPRPPPPVPPAYDAVWRPGTTGERQVYNEPFAVFESIYEDLWPKGWRLYLLNTYIVNGQWRYDAVWRPGTSGEIQVYGWQSAHFKAKYDELYAQGWRIRMLNPYR